MSHTPADLMYTSTHEWLQKNGDDTVTVGISDHAQELLGDVVFVELPEAGQEVGCGEQLAMLESVKAASDVYTPVSGEVVAVNTALADAPELVNDSCYGDGWLVTLRALDANEFSNLLDAETYVSTTAEN